MARLFCDDGNHIHSVQPKAFLRISHKYGQPASVSVSVRMPQLNSFFLLCVSPCRNPLSPCSDIPIVDLAAWKDISGTDDSHSGIPDDLLHGLF